MPSIFVARMATVFASRTFFARPTMNRRRPAPKSPRFSLRLRIWSWMVWYRTMGPAMSCGNIEMYMPRYSGLRWAGTSPRYTSIT